LADEEQSLDEEIPFEEGEPEGAPGKGKKKIILIAVLALLVVGGGGAGVYFSGILDGPKETAETKEPPPPVKKVFYGLPVTLTNLNGSGRRPGVLKARVILELIEGADIDRLDQLQPRIVDILQVFLRELRIDDLRGSNGLVRLRRELLARINEAVEPVEVSGVLFREILIQ
jgi:flagellar protein FliL